MSAVGPLLLGGEVHLDGLRGRWEFQGDIGYTARGAVREIRQRAYGALPDPAHPPVDHRSSGHARRRSEDDIDSPASA